MWYQSKTIEDIASKLKIFDNQNKRNEIEEFSIPSNIKVTSSFAFHLCTNLTKLEISPNSYLQIIGPDSFQGSGLIESISILKKVTEICEEAFKKYEHLKSVNFSWNSELQIIGKESFSNTWIEEIFYQKK